MASPTTPTSANDGTDAKAPLQQITFRFCSECSNMLYPKEDEESRTLQFTCRTCQYTEEAKSSCVFRNFINSAQGETAGVTQDVGSDPTVGAAVARGDARTRHRDGDADPMEDACFVCTMCLLPVVCDSCGKLSPTLGVVPDRLVRAGIMDALELSPADSSPATDKSGVGAGRTAAFTGYATEDGGQNAALGLDAFAKERYTDYDDDEEESEDVGEKKATVYAGDDNSPDAIAERLRTTLLVKN